ncbi:MAG: hypothetical protein MZV70_29050 [Desulfobacterales bacterium]|nr:hypothetical protein [Desulfobacterales bacterium]
MLDEARRVGTAARSCCRRAPQRPGAGLAPAALFRDVALTYVEDKAFDYRRGYERLTEQFQHPDAGGFRLRGLQGRQ